MAKGKSKPSPVIKPMAVKTPAIPLPSIHLPNRIYTQQDAAALYAEFCRQVHWELAAAPGLRPMTDLGGCLVVVKMGWVPYQERKDGPANS